MADGAGNERTLEQRIRLIEDRLEIYNLIAGHPPSAIDTTAGPGLGRQSEVLHTARIHALASRARATGSRRGSSRASSRTWG